MYCLCIHVYTILLSWHQQALVAIEKLYNVAAETRIRPFRYGIHLLHRTVVV